MAAVPAAVSGQEKESSLEERRKRLRAARGVIDEYGPVEIQEEFLDHVQDELDDLADRGVLSSADLSDFEPLADNDSVDEVSENGKVGLSVTIFEQTDEVVAKLSAYAETKSHSVDVLALPEVDFVDVVVRERGSSGKSSEIDTHEIAPKDCDGYCDSDWDLVYCNCDPTNPISPIHCIRNDEQEGGNCYDCGPPCDDCDNQDKCDDSSDW